MYNLVSLCVVHSLPLVYCICLISHFLLVFLEISLICLVMPLREKLLVLLWTQIVQSLLVIDLSWVSLIGNFEVFRRRSIYFFIPHVEMIVSIMDLDNVAPYSFFNQIVSLRPPPKPPIFIDDIYSFVRPTSEAGKPSLMICYSQVWTRHQWNHHWGSDLRANLFFIVW